MSTYFGVANVAEQDDSSPLDCLPLIDIRFTGPSCYISTCHAINGPPFFSRQRVLQARPISIASVSSDKGDRASEVSFGLLTDR